MRLGGDAAIGLPISDEEDDRSAGGEAGDKPSNGTISQSFEKGIITKKRKTVNILPTNVIIQSKKYHQFIKKK